MTVCTSIVYEHALTRATSYLHNKHSRVASPLRSARVTQGVLDSGRQERVSPVQQQQRHHLQVPVRRRDLQRRLGAPVLVQPGAALDVGAPLNQVLGERKVPGEGRVSQRSPVLGVAEDRVGRGLRVDRRTGVHQVSHDRLVSVEAGQHQGCEAEFVERIDLQIKEKIELVQNRASPNNRQVV